MMDNLPKYEDWLLNLKAQPDPDLPPAAPAEWAWKHIEIAELGGIVHADRLAEYRQGCQRCFRNGGYVTAVANEGYRTLKECPDCAILLKRIKRINAAMLPSKFNCKKFNWSLLTEARGIDLQQAVMAWVNKLACERDLADVASISLLGPTGVGKSHAAFSAARALLELDVDVKWVNWIKMIDGMRKSWRDDSEAKSRDDIWNAVFKIKSGVIIVDDLGAGSVTPYSRQIACDLFEMCPSSITLLITSNGIPDGKDEHSMEHIIGSRAASRLSGLCSSGKTLFKLTGDDFRKKGAS